MELNFFSEDVDFNLSDETKIHEWLIKMINSEKAQLGSVNIIFCSDAYLLDMNKQYLDHDYYTDVITFDYCEENIISGDIFISIDRVRENAAGFDCSFEQELNRVMGHGTLHLLGYKDKTSEEKEEMRAKENEYLAILA